MITFYHFSHWCGYFRTVSVTKTLEEFNAHLKEQDCYRKGNVIYNNRNDEACGNITEDTCTTEGSNPDPILGGHITILQH
jgi:hypothetical protein